MDYADNQSIAEGIRQMHGEDYASLVAESDQHLAALNEHQDMRKVYNTKWAYHQLGLMTALSCGWTKSPEDSLEALIQIQYGAAQNCENPAHNPPNTIYDNPPDVSSLGFDGCPCEVLLIHLTAIHRIIQAWNLGQGASRN